MFIKEKDLGNVVIDGENSQIFYLSQNYLAKKFKDPLTFSLKLQRYEYAKEIGKIDGVSLPIDKLETEQGFCGYIENIIPGTFDKELINFGDYINEKKWDITLEEITNYFLQCENIVTRCHEYDIINPDMGSKDNVLYNKNEKRVYFTDYQDMQIKNIPSIVLSSFVVVDPILASKKYQTNGFYTPNIDLYTLAIKYFYYTTKINVPRAMASGCNINELLTIANISDTSFGACMRRLYHHHKNNLEISEAIKELNTNYVLTPFVKGQPKKFIKK